MEPVSLLAFGFVATGSLWKLRSYLQRASGYSQTYQPIPTHWVSHELAKGRAQAAPRKLYYREQ